MTRKSKPARVAFAFAWYDFWVGLYYDRERRILFVCPLPMCLITIRLGETEKDS
jgi:hypothetical protein